MSGVSPINYPEIFRVRVPSGLPLAVRQAARLRHVSPGEWARQVLLHALEAQGVHLREANQQEASQ